MSRWHVPELNARDELEPIVLATIAAELDPWPTASTQADPKRMEEMAARLGISEPCARRVAWAERTTIDRANVDDRSRYRGSFSIAATSIARP